MSLSRSSSEPTPPRRRQRRAQRSFPRAAVAVLALVVVGAWGWWFNEHRTISWSQALDPTYWWHRWRGDDLYDADEAILMHGNRSLPEVALTFDDGPHIQSCGSILETLKRYGVHATFFDVGKRMAQNPELLRQTVDDGNEVGNHTYTHPRLPKLPERARHREINDTDITYYRITGRHLTLLRPPGMRYSPEVVSLTKQLGYIVVGYDDASHDFDPHTTPDFIVNRTLSRVENGSIILLHDYPGPAKALPRIIEGLQARGFRCVTIGEMLAHLPDRQRAQVRQFLAAHADPTNPIQARL